MWLYIIVISVLSSCVNHYDSILFEPTIDLFSQNVAVNKMSKLPEDEKKGNLIGVFNAAASNASRIQTIEENVERAVNDTVSQVHT